MNFPSRPGEFLETLVALELRNERARKALQLHQARVGVFDHGARRRRWRRRTAGWICGLLGLLLICSVVAKTMVRKCHGWVDALYFSVVTLSTIGDLVFFMYFSMLDFFGDSPFMGKPNTGEWVQLVSIGSQQILRIRGSDPREGTW